MSAIITAICWCNNRQWPACSEDKIGLRLMYVVFCLLRCVAYILRLYTTLDYTEYILYPVPKYTKMAIQRAILCIAILVYLGTWLGTSLFMGRGHSPLPKPHPHYPLYSALCCSIGIYTRARPALCIDRHFLHEIDYIVYVKACLIMN